MHLLVRETRSLDEEESAVDLGQSPAEIVLLSFSDSDLGAIAAAWQAMDATARPTLRLASLARLRHPMSVDLYAEQVIAHCRTRLTGYKVPKYVRFRSEPLPKSPVGKVLRRLVREEVAKEAAGAVAA